MVLVRGGDERERLAGAAVGQPGVVRVGERRREQRPDPAQPLRRERDRARPAVAADGAAGRAADSRRAPRRRRTRRSCPGAAGSRRARAASAGRRARAGRAPAVRGARDGISSSRSRNRVSAVNARSFASCSGKRRSIASAPISPTASRYGSSRASWCERAQVGAGDRLQLAGALVQHQLDVRERLEPRAEARLRPPHALRDRADAAAVGRVDVQDAVGLAEPERAEHDRLRPVRARHPPSLRRGRDGARSRARRLCVGTTQAAIDRHGCAGRESLCCFNTSSRAAGSAGRTRCRGRRRGSSRAACRSGRTARRCGRRP